MLTDDDDELLPFGSPLQHGVLTPVLPSTGSNKRRPPDEQPLHDESVHDRIKRLRIASFNSSDGGGPSDMPPGAAPSALPHPGLARAWAAASPPSSPPSQAPSSQPQHPTPASGAHPAASAADAADDDGAAYSEVNSLLRSLHLERVAKGRQKEWVEEEE